jgi:FAD/FMN-containing dehydrogenase
MSAEYPSWGRYPAAKQDVFPVYWREGIRFPEGTTLLPRGLGRSYGDVCLNDGGTLIAARGLDRLIRFDSETGVLRVEAGVSLDEILAFAVPRGWFLPVTPGTKFVTVGGAIGNDVHGKNHHVAGTFGRHVREFVLLRSDGERMVCSGETNPGMFAATVGGLGLTGLILEAEIQLKPVRGREIDVELIRFGNLEEFFALSAESETGYEYVVSWVDCLAAGKGLGRGIFMRGNHRAEPDRKRHKSGGALPVPVDFPGWVLNPLSIWAFNTLYYHKQVTKRSQKVVDYEPFFYPLDALMDWNRMYGRDGFLQHQCVVPNEAIGEILARIARSGWGSFLAVMKLFGDVESPGMLSFPKRGVTLALDFQNKGPRMFEFLDELDRIVVEAGGRINPSKDARMAAEHFRSFYPRLNEFTRYVDARFSSSFYRRVGGAG